MVNIQNRKVAPAITNPVTSDVRQKLSEVARTTLDNRMVKVLHNWILENQYEVLEVLPLNLTSIRAKSETDTSALYVIPYSNYKFIRDAFTAAGWKIRIFSGTQMLQDTYTFTHGDSKAVLSLSQMSHGLQVSNSNHEKVASLPYTTPDDLSVIFATLFVENIEGWHGISQKTKLKHIVIQPIVAALTEALIY